MTVRKSLALAMAVSGSAGPAMAADWTGPYVGITGGGGWGQQAQHGGILTLPSGGGVSSGTMSTSVVTSTIMTTSISSSVVVADGSYKLSGGLVGGSVGYNWQQDRFVYGLEGDGSWADITGSGTCGFGGAIPHACGGGIHALGTVRGRIGYDLGTLSGPFGGFMVFAAGGLAVADVKSWDALFGTSGSRAIAGWTVGAGIEAKFATKWSVTLEYLHVDLGEHGLFTAIPPNAERVRTTADLVRVGLSYHFDWVDAPTPVIARY